MCLAEWDDDVRYFEEAEQVLQRCLSADPTWDPWQPQLDEVRNYHLQVLGRFDQSYKELRALTDPDKYPCDVAVEAFRLQLLGAHKPGMYMDEISTRGGHSCAARIVCKPDQHP